MPHKPLSQLQQLRAQPCSLGGDVVGGEVGTEAEEPEWMSVPARLAGGVRCDLDDHLGYRPSQIKTLRASHLS